MSVTRWNGYGTKPGMRRDDEEPCEVCFGLGTYPVINRWGEELYSIPCPECRATDLARLAIANKIDRHRKGVVNLRSRKKDL